MGFTRAELEAVRGTVVPDLIGADLRLLFVGINPGLWTAAAQAHFAHPGNRFYRALHLAGITRWQIDATSGFRAEDLAELTARDVGITNLVERATARADELTRPELIAGGEALAAKVGLWRPAVVAVVGLTAYRSAFGRPKATIGPQDELLAGAQVWALPNPSGLNAHHDARSLATLYRAAAEAAHVPLDPPPVPTGRG